MLKMTKIIPLQDSIGVQHAKGSNYVRQAEEMITEWCE
jgi:hypothetical protein